MPQIMMRDAFGMGYQISTRSREMLQAWFDEWLPRLYPPDTPDEYGLPLIMSIYPLPGDPGGNDGWDWAADTRYITQPFTIPRDPALALQALDDRRKWIEAQL